MSVLTSDLKPRNILELAVRQSTSAGNIKLIWAVRSKFPCRNLLYTFTIPSLPKCELSTMFRATSRLLSCRITFFTRSPCGLCDTAKAVVQDVKAKRPLAYEEINVMEPGQERWRSLYEFDTPVVCFPSVDIGCERVPECRTDPHRRRQRARDYTLVVEAHASVQTGRSADDDGCRRATMSL